MNFGLWWKQQTCKHRRVETYPYTVYTHHYGEFSLKKYAVTSQNYRVVECLDCGAVLKMKI